jgi:transcriptional regulator with XRE-family HTH domain
MTPEEIRLEFFRKRREINFSKIARQLGVSRQAVSYVIDRQFVSNRIMEAVADALGKDVKYVFHEYYLKKASH